MFARKQIIILAAMTVFTTLSAAIPTQAFAAGQEIVKFRLTNWKTAHFDDGKKAQTHAATLKQIGCDVKQGAHGDHHDVSYRCPNWRSIALKSHNEAHQWERWLKANGFQTSHQH